jgi:hypothetical protein
LISIPQKELAVLSDGKAGLQLKVILSLIFRDYVKWSHDGHAREFD